jgi:hypothetical protein
MKINEVQDIKEDVDGSTYRQSVLEDMKEAYNTNWDEVEGIEINEEYIAELRTGKKTLWD